MATFKKRKKQELLTLFSSNVSIDKFTDVVKAVFNDKIESSNFEEENKFVIVLDSQADVEFNFINDENKVKKQVDGLVSIYSQAQLENIDMKKEILKEISNFNNLVEVLIYTNKNEELRQYIREGIYKVAKELNAFVFLTNMSLYSGDEKLMISIDGKTELENFKSRVKEENVWKDKINITEEDNKRVEESMKILKEKGIIYLDNLKPIAVESNTNLRSTEDIIRRLAAIFTTSVQGEVYLNPKFKNRNKREVIALQVRELSARYDVQNYLTEEEQYYLDNPTKDFNLHYKYIWCYESCAVLLWALSLMELDDPVKNCNMQELATLVWTNDFNGLLEKAKLRSKEEILALQDLTYRYNWACVDAKIKNEAPTASLNSSVVYQREYALNWLLSVDGVEDWEDVSVNI